ncbi:LysM peptidoglycan-binding domain-containing protein [Blastococcus litoris]|uniref:LysM peptidoglycan-binding domain-containing protein n=1 Tax=Blastococcus litoris TaxID=2171622 RepID=UPI000E30270D|nr:LysM domain-containing protein [Blastococcus litoris]
MSIRRLVLTSAGMALFAVLLVALTPPMSDLATTLAAPQRTADTAGPDALVLAVAGVLAWVVWSWGCLGLALTAASTLPGLLGSGARLATHVVLPAGARRSAAVLLGIGLGVAAPLAAAATPLLATPAVAASPAAVPDWPAAERPAPAPASTGAVVPDWPEPAAQGAHVVVRGDCLWHIAQAHLLDRSRTPPTELDVAREVHAWWTTNADVIGPDPDRLLPGQVLRPPDAG